MHVGGSLERCLTWNISFIHEALFFFWLDVNVIEKGKNGNEQVNISYPSKL